MILGRKIIERVGFMALFTISDLHLPLGIDKPMNIFGSRWDNYVEKTEKNWQAIVGAEDTVVMPGDFSWATYLSQSKKDFEFLEKLNGRKILLKGNHDYWWTSKSKTEQFFSENNIKSVSILNNDCVFYEKKAICGTRGWNLKPETEEDKKIYAREIIRLELSLKAAVEKNPEEIIVFTHYPPVAENSTENEFTELFEKYSVKKCFYGHLHGDFAKFAKEGKVNKTEFKLVSADSLKFVPYKIY